MIQKFLPISEVARRFGIRASGLRYYEQIALLMPAMRQSGKRHYGPAELKRLALIQLLQDTGRLSLEEIASILARPTGEKSARKILNDRIAILKDQIRSAEAAKSYLEYRLSCPRENPFDGCPALAQEVNRRFKLTGLLVQTGDVHPMGAHEGHCHPKSSRDQSKRSRMTVVE